MTLRIGTIESGRGSLDHEATWLLGHTRQIGFGALREEKGSLLVPAVLHVSCAHLKVQGQEATCRAHQFRGRLPDPPPKSPEPRRLGGDRFAVVQNHRLTELSLPYPRQRRLPVVQGENPCETAPCRTADNRRGSACCRDLQVEILCRKEDAELEALIRSRRSPYLCKITREADDSIEAEMISACDFLDEAGSCTLHGRLRADRRPAKPDLCSEWPPKNKGLHPGCVFAGRGSRRKSPKRGS